MNCHELSLVPFGADPGASVSSSFGGEDADKLKVEFGKLKDEIMSNTQNDNLQTENIELKQQVTDLEAQIAQLKESHQSEIEDLKLNNQKEIATLQQDNETLQGKVDEMSEELAQFRAEAQAKAEAELAEKKEELQKLAEELNIERTLGDVDEMSEEFIDRQIATFKEILENRPEQKEQPGQFQSGEQPHKESRKEKGQYSALLKAFKG